MTIINQCAKVKGEVRAICRFWVFDGNGLLGHRLIDSRWFEKNPPTESGWKRRSRKTPTYRYFARKWSWRNMCFQIRAISSRLWFTYIFAFDSGFLSITGGWRKCGTLLIFCQTVVLVCPLLLQEEQEARVKGFAVARFRKRPEIDPGGHLADCTWLCGHWGAQPAHVFALESWPARSVWGPTRLRLCQAFTF